MGTYPYADGNRVREKHGEFLLRELVLRWKNHKVMVKWLSRFFNYLDRYYISRRSLLKLKAVGWRSFETLVICSSGIWLSFYMCTASEEAYQFLA